MSIDKNNHLREVLDTHKMCHVQNFVNKVKNVEKKLKPRCTTTMVATSIHRLDQAVLLNIPPPM